jgi:hypothetical protein
VRFIIFAVGSYILSIKNENILISLLLDSWLIPDKNESKEASTGAGFFIIYVGANHM